MKKFSSLTAWIIVLVFIVLGAVALAETNKSSSAIPFNEFQKQWTQNNVKNFKLRDDNMTVEGALTNGTSYVTIVPAERLFQFISQHPNENVGEVYDRPTNLPGWLNILPTIMFVIMLFAFWFFFMQQSQGGGGNRGVMNFGKSKAKLATPDKRKITFEDVAGADEEKQELAEIVDFLKNSKKYM